MGAAAAPEPPPSLRRAARPIPRRCPPARAAVSARCYRRSGVRVEKIREVGEGGDTAVRVQQLPAQRCVIEVRGAPPLHHRVAPQYRGRTAAADEPSCPRSGAHRDARWSGSCRRDIPVSTSQLRCRGMPIRQASQPPGYEPGGKGRQRYPIATASLSSRCSASADGTPSSRRPSTRTVGTTVISSSRARRSACWCASA